jgi:hypothetical protein
MIPQRNTTVSIQTRSEDVQQEEVPAADDGNCANSNGSTSEDEGDSDYEKISTREVAEVSTGALRLGGPPSNIHMENNSDIQIGSRLHYNAPVTINQYVSVVGSNDMPQDGILQEAVRAPIHGLDHKENGISQGAFSRWYTTRYGTLPAAFRAGGYTNLAQNIVSSSSSYLSQFSYYYCIFE